MQSLLTTLRAGLCRHGLRASAIALFALLCQLFALPLAAPAGATGVYEMPPTAPMTWVLDQSDIISRSNEGKINTALGDLADNTGYEVRFITIHRLDYGETTSTFTEALFQQWFPTPEAQAKQTLLVMDDVTNETAIRSGDEAKALLTDEIAQSITGETILYPLKEGYKYNQAMTGASDRMTAVLSGSPDPGPPTLKDTVNTDGTFATKEKTQESNATVWVIVLLVAATVIPMATYYLYVR
jgi:uncharacterized protein